MGRLSVQERRDKIASVYESHWWKAKVKRMSIKQVCAIYDNFERTGKFNAPDPNYIQMTLWDFGVEYVKPTRRKNNVR